MNKRIQFIIVFLCVCMLMGCGASSWQTNYSYPGYQQTMSVEVIDAPNGNYYVAGFAQGTESDPDGEAVFVAAFGAKGKFKWSYQIDSVINLDFLEGENILSTDPDSNLYVAWNQGSAKALKIYKIDPNGQLVDQLNDDPAHGGLVNDIAIGPEGNVYVATQSFLYAYSAAGDFLWASEFVDIFALVAPVQTAKLSIRASRFQRDGGYNLRVLDNGDIVQTARYFVSQHSQQGALINLGRVNNEIGIDSITDSTLVGNTMLVGGNIAGEWQAIGKLNDSLALTDFETYAYWADIEIEGNDTQVCVEIDGDDALGRDISTISLFDTQLNLITQTELEPLESAVWPVSIHGFADGCYISVVKSDSNGLFTELNFLRASGELAAKGILANVYVKDFLVRGKGIVQLGDNLNAAGESESLVLVKRPL